MLKYCAFFQAAVALDDENVDMTIEVEHDEVAAEDGKLCVADRGRKRRSCVCITCHICVCLCIH